MKAGALQNKVYGPHQVAHLLQDAEDECDLEDLVFANHIDAFKWIHMCMEKPNDEDFSKAFRSVELFWVPDEVIPKKLVVEKECRKIPKVMSINCVAATQNQQGVFYRDSTCSFCSNCANGDVLICTGTLRNGEWRQYVIGKTKKLARTQAEVVEVICLRRTSFTRRNQTIQMTRMTRFHRLM